MKNKGIIRELKKSKKKYIIFSPEVVTSIDLQYRGFGADSTTSKQKRTKIGLSKLFTSNVIIIIITFSVISTTTTSTIVDIASDYPPR